MSRIRVRITGLVGAAGLAAFFLASSRAHGFDATATVRNVNAANRTVEVVAGGQVRVLHVAADALLLDENGKPLADGLGAGVWKPGALVTLTVERTDDGPVLKAIRLGASVKQPSDPPAPAEKGNRMQALARFRGFDRERRVVTLELGGSERVVPVAQDVKVLDVAGKELAGGLSSTELKAGASLLVEAERSANGPIVRLVRLRGATGPHPLEAPQFDTTQLKPLTDLGAGKYHGFEGGLYPGGKNNRPAEHERAGVDLGQTIQPLDEAGKPSSHGKIVLLTLGMSNTSQASEAFLRLAKADADMSPAVVIVNGAQGGMTAFLIQNPDDGGPGSRYWSTVDERLHAAGVTRAQVQAAWIKEADANPTQGFPGYARTLQAELARVVQLLPGRFPHIKQAFLSSRTYGGWARAALNPEPYAFESGLSVKWLIEQQLVRDPSLNWDPARGAVKAPWLSWGPYLWANGATPRADGFSYLQGDFAEDGTHESPGGQTKVGGMLLRFFKTDSATRRWFLRKAS